MTTTVDARGLACPEPVIRTRKAMSDDANEIIAIVDNETAQHNVSRMAVKAGYSVEADQRSDGTYVVLRRGEHAERPEMESVGRGRASSVGPLVLLVGSDQMGRGSEELGRILLSGFLYALQEAQPRPDTLIFLNHGVRLASEGSSVLEDLRSLADSGVEILACGTCLEFLGLSDKLRVGEVSNMYIIAETLLRAGKVLAL